MYCACCAATAVSRMLCCCLFYLSVRFVLRIGFAESVSYCPDHGVRFPVGQRYFRSAPHIDRLTLSYEGCPESMQQFWISREPIVWPWCNLVASQRRPYCASANSHSPVGLVSLQWDAVDWACVLRDRRIHYDWASRSASSRLAPLYSTAIVQVFFWRGPGAQSITSPRSVSLPTAQIWLPATSGFSQS